MFKLTLSTRAQGDLRTISPKYRQALKSVFQEIKEDAELGKPLHKELTGMLAWKFGPIRIVYRINKSAKNVFIVTIGHRSTVYQ